MSNPSCEPDRLDRAFRAALEWRGVARAEPASHIGIEQEYTLFRGDEKLDFRTMIHTAGVSGLRLDPGDSHAYRLSDGGALTCDKFEAETVSPPVSLERGLAGELEAWSLSGRAHLHGLLAEDIEVRGCSTHISAAMPAHLNDAAAVLFSRTFTPLLMLLMGDRRGGGIFVRPRAGRLELCGFYVDGDYLRLASAVAAGGALACAGALVDRVAPLMPPPVSPQLTNCKSRFGLRIARNAFGFDLYEDPRAAVIETAEGSMTVLEQVSAAWEAAMCALDGYVPTELRSLGEDILRGAAPFHNELEPPGALLTPRSEATATPSPLGRVIREEHRPGYALSPLLSTWDTTVLRAATAGISVALNVPTPALAKFYDGLDGGQFDSLIEARIRSGNAGNVLSDRRSALQPGFFDAVIPRAVLARERPREWDAVRIVMSNDPSTARDEDSGRPPEGPVGTIDTGEARELKPLVGFFGGETGREIGATFASTPPVRESLGWGSWTRWLGGGIAVVLAMLGFVAITLGGGGDGDDGEEEPSQPAPGIALNATDTPTTTPTPTATATATATPPGNSDVTPVTPEPGGQAVITPTATVTQPGSGGASPTPTSGVVVTPTPTVALPDTPTPTATTAAAVLSGNRTTAFVTASNPGNHPCPVGPNLEVNFLIQRDGPPQPGTAIFITVTIPGFATLNGSTAFGPGFDSQGGTASAVGSGQYCGFTTSFTTSFTISPGGVSGTLVVGGSGLPGGEAITFSFSGGAPH